MVKKIKLEYVDNPTKEKNRVPELNDGTATAELVTPDQLTVKTVDDPQLNALYGRTFKRYVSFNDSARLYRNFLLEQTHNSFIVRKGGAAIYVIPFTDSSSDAAEFKTVVCNLLNELAGTVPFLTVLLENGDDFNGTFWERGRWSDHVARVHWQQVTSAERPNVPLDGADNLLHWSNRNVKVLSGELEGVQYVLEQGDDGKQKVHVYRPYMYGNKGHSLVYLTTENAPWTYIGGQYETGLVLLGYIVGDWLEVTDPTTGEWVNVVCLAQQDVTFKNNVRQWTPTHWQTVVVDGLAELNRQALAAEKAAK